MNFHSPRGGFRSSIPGAGKREDINNRYLDNKTYSNFPWVSNDILNKSYAISIRLARYNSFKKRMGPWASNVEKINGINGHDLNIHELHKSNFIERTSSAHETRENRMLHISSECLEKYHRKTT